MYELAGGDVTKMERVTLIYIEEALTFMAYERDIRINQNINLNANSSRHK
tara:strand:- start:389 stop:538 length:150 start_codon:yes stop_codon:yes gene_type:complete